MPMESRALARIDVSQVRRCLLFISHVCLYAVAQDNSAIGHQLSGAPASFVVVKGRVKIIRNIKARKKREPSVRLNTMRRPSNTYFFAQSRSVRRGGKISCTKDF